MPLKNGREAVGHFFFMYKLIGTNFETSLHRELKFLFCGYEGQTEVEIGGYVADGINEQGEIVEVQIGNLGPLKNKVKEFAANNKVRVIHPVIITKYIEVYDCKGNKLYRRKSPRRGCPWDIFNALIYAPDLPLVPNLTITLAMVDIVEKRLDDGKGSWRRKGLSIKDRNLMELREKICLKSLKDYLQFLPFKKRESFTSSLLAQRASLNNDLARKTIYVLFRVGLIKRIGKDKKAWIYKICQTTK